MDMQISSRDLAQRGGILKWVPLIVLSLALMIIVLDTTILNVSLRTIINDLHTNIQRIQWVITAYSLTIAALTIPGGRLGDLFGRKKMFMAGAAIFAIGSFITSISKSVGMMIAGEAIIEGIGAALMMPATTSLLVSNYSGRDRQLAFGVWGGIAAAASALGPVFGGWLTTYYSWRWAFRINLVVALVLILGAVLVKEIWDTEEQTNLDYFGVFLSALGLTSITYGVIESSTYGWFKAIQPFALFGHNLNLGSLSIVPIFIGLGLIILGLFAWWESYVQQSCRTPLVSLKLFRNKQFITGASLTAILSLAMAGLSFTTPVFFQSVKNLDPLHTGFAMLPMSLSLLVAAPFSAYISKFITPKRIIQFGLIAAAVAFFMLRLEIKVTASAWSLAPGFIIFGIGMGFMMSQTNNMTLSAVSVQESGEASGVNSTMRQVGSTFGSAILGAILISTLSVNLLSGINASKIIPQNLKPLIGKAASQQSSSIEFGTPSQIASNLPAAVSSEITQISYAATVSASRSTLLWGDAFVLVALLLSLALPSTADIEISQSAAAPQDPELIPRNIARRRALIFAVTLAIVALIGGYFWGKSKEKKIIYSNFQQVIPANPNNGLPPLGR